MADAARDLWLGDRSESTTTDFDGRLRRCHVLGRLTAETADDSVGSIEGTPSTMHLWVRLDPPLVLGDGRFEEVVLRARHVGYDIDRLGDSSISVYLFEIRSKDGFDRGHFRPGTLRLLVWADVARDPAFLPETQEDGFDRIFEILRRYAEREGDGNVPLEHREDGVALGNWVHNMKRSQAHGTLRADWAQRLAALARWRWGVDADRDWNVAASHGPMWLMAPDGAGTLGLDRRARYCEPIGDQPTIGGSDGRPSISVYVFPPAELDGAETGMLLIRAIEPGVDPREFADGVLTVEVEHIRSWRRLADGTRRPDEVSNLGTAVVGRDPALLPAMSESEWQAGLAGLRTCREKMGHCWVPLDYVPDGNPATAVHLGGWALRVRSDHRRGTLSAARSAALESVAGWKWSWAEG
jgi:hypothetical protein